jgi:hypothetical protein
VLLFYIALIVYIYVAVLATKEDFWHQI